MAKLNAQHHRILAEIVTETKKGPQTFAFALPMHAKPLADAGYIESNAAIKSEDGKGIAHRATQAGIAYSDSLATQAPAANTGFSSGAATAPARSSAPMTFEIEDNIPFPEQTRRGGFRPSVYPFDQLQKGQSFFIPATEERPEPWRQLSSTVNSANLRFSTPHATETITNRKGNVVARRVQSRLFKITQSERDGVKGARVFRTE